MRVGAGLGVTTRTGLEVVGRGARTVETLVTLRTEVTRTVRGRTVVLRTVVGLVLVVSTVVVRVVRFTGSTVERSTVVGLVVSFSGVSTGEGVIFTAGVSAAFTGVFVTGGLEGVSGGVILGEGVFVAGAVSTGVGDFAGVFSGVIAGEGDSTGVFSGGFTGEGVFAGEGDFAGVFAGVFVPGDAGDTTGPFEVEGGDVRACGFGGLGRKLMMAKIRPAMTMPRTIMMPTGDFFFFSPAISSARLRRLDGGRCLVFSYRGASVTDGARPFSGAAAAGRDEIGAALGGASRAFGASTFEEESLTDAGFEGAAGSFCRSSPPSVSSREGRGITGGRGPLRCMKGGVAPVPEGGDSVGAGL
jgi:hypothetical protein